MEILQRQRRRPGGGKKDVKKEGSKGRERFMRGSGIEECFYECLRCVLVNVSVRPHVQRECMRDLTIRKTVEKKEGI